MALIASKYSLAFVVIAAFQICAGAIVMCEAADDTEAATKTWTSGACTCTLDDATGVFTVTGSGQMADYSISSDQPWASVRTSITSLVIESGVTTIGQYTFNGCTSLASVTIPSGVTSMNANAFQQCASLASVTIPSTVTSFGQQVFQNCTSLTSITFEATTWNITSIGYQTFSFGKSSVPVTATVYSPNNVANGQLDGYKGSYTTLNYEALPSTVTINVNDPSYGSVSQSTVTNVPSGTSVSVSDNVLTIGTTNVTATAQSGYRFASWSGIPAGGTITQDTTITAVFEPDAYTVTITVNDPTYGSVSVNSLTVPYGTPIGIDTQTGLFTVGTTAVTATPATATAQYRYEFRSWLWVPNIDAVTEDITATATFDRYTNQYTVTVNVNDAAYGSVDAASFTVYYGTAISAAANVLTVGSSTSTATPAAATAQYTFAFDSWSGIPAGGTVTEDFTVTAVFARTVNQYTVTVAVNQADWGSVSTASFTVDYGTAISSAAAVLTVGSSTSTATPAAATAQYTFAFDSWSGIPAGGTVTEDVTITAVFTRTVNQYTVTVAVNQADWGSVSTASFTVDYGTAISSAAAVLTVGSSTSTATATAATAQYTFAFDSWSGIPSGGTVTEDFTVTAVFARTVNQYTVTVTVNDSTYGSVDVSSITVDYGSAISAAGNVLTVGSSTSRATPASFAVFDSWSGVPAGGTVTGNVTVTAVFTVTFATGGIAYAGTGSGTDVTVMGLSGVPAAFTLIASVDYGGVTWTVTGIDAHAFDDVTLQDHRDPITTPTIGQHFVLHDGIYWLDGWHPNPHYIIGGAALTVIPLLIIVCILVGALAFVGARRDI